MKHAAFVFLLSLSTVPSRSSHAVADVNISIFFMAESRSIVYMHHFFIYVAIDEHLGCVHIVAIVNKAAVKIWM